MCWPACRALSGLFVTSLIKFSGVGGLAFVQWCSMMWAWRALVMFSRIEASLLDEVESQHPKSLTESLTATVLPCRSMLG